MLILLILFVQELPPITTPGKLNPKVTQANIRSTVCVAGWTKTVRPSSRFTNRIKQAQIKALGLTGQLKDYEEDHRVPLALGGHPTDEANLWPELWEGRYGARKKDRLESALHRDVCAGRMKLSTARAIFLINWWVEYKRRYEPR